MGFELLRPGLAWLLVFAPLALLAGLWALARSRRELALWVAERHRARFLPGASPARARARLACGAAALAFLALAALGPVRGYTYRAVSRKGLDLVVCLDTSRSMLAQDLRPSRLERAKREILGLLELLHGDRVALVAFSGDARDVAPLTRDKETLRGLLGYVTTDDNQEGGTDLAAAIERALGLLDEKSAAHQAIVLLTDGEDLAGKAAAQADEAARRNVRVFVVGVGTEAGGKIPIVDENGRSAFLRDPDGQEVVTKLERESLAALAARTGGEFLSAEESPTPLEELYKKRVTRIQGREIEGGERRVPYDRFQWPLALGLACLVAELVLRSRAPRRRERAEARLAAALLPLVAFGGGTPPAVPQTLASAVQLYRRGEGDKAEAAARALLAPGVVETLGDAERARAQFALGVITATRALEKSDGSPEAQERVHAARAAANEALSAARALAGPGELRADATYDLGALELFHAEDVRARIPEISGQPAGAAAPPGALTLPPGAAPGATPGAPAGAPAPPDPLPEARELYRSARTWLIERLRLDASDEDTRADLELVQRRLHELDEIEKKREEEKQKQDKQNQDKDDKSDKDKNDKDSKDNKDKQNQKNDKDKQDGDKDPGDSKDKQDPDKKDQQKPKPDESKPDQPPKPGDEDEKKDKKDDKKDQPQPEDGKKDEAKEGQPPAGDQKPPAERVLTREQVMQLLDRLSDLEKQQKALEAALRASKRARTKRDW